MRTLSRLVVVASLVTAWLVLPAHSGYADQVSGGRLDWGVKASFRQYVVGPIAQGQMEVAGGATTTGDGLVRFHSASGDYQPGDGAYHASYSGGVRFTGHQRDDGSYQLDLTIANPTVEISGGDSTLYVDVTSGTDTRRRVPFANLEISHVDVDGAGTAAASGVPATLTAQGAAAFAGYYQAGQQLDPVAFSGDVARAAPDDEPDQRPQPSDSPEPDAEPGTTGDRAFTGAVVDWGVRDTFREHITGEIARGGWELTGGAAAGGPVFRFPAGDGHFDAGEGELAASFQGAVRFTGTGLDLTLSSPSVQVAGGEGTLSAEVTAAAAAPERVDLVTFPAGDLEPAGGLLLIEAAPATLTADGAAVFQGFYPEGSDMDPVTVAVPLTDGTELPALPDPGRDPSPPSPVPATPAAAAAATQDDGPDPGLVAIAVAVGVAILAGVAVAGAAVWRRRGPAGEPDPTTEPGSATEPDPTTEPGPTTSD